MNICRTIWLPLVIALALSGVAAAKYSVGQEVADFSAQTASGSTVRLSDQTDKVVVLVFWGSNCRGSEGYVRRLEALKSEFSGRNVVFWAVASNSNETPAGVQAAKAEQGLGWPVLMDGSKAIANAFGPGVTPAAYVIDGSRRMRYGGQIDDDPRGTRSDKQQYLREAITAVLGGGAPPASNTPRGIKIQ